MMGLKEYLELKASQVRLKATDELSKAFGALLSWMLIISVAVSVITVLAFAFILLLGDILDNYALGAFIVAAVLLIGLAALWFNRRKLFVGQFVKLLSKANSYEELQAQESETALKVQSMERGIADWNWIALRALRILRRMFHV